MDLRLTAAWEKRKQLCAEGRKLYVDGRKLYADGRKLCADGWWLSADGDIAFIAAVIAVHGPETTIEWTDAGCTLSTGEAFGRFVSINNEES